MVRKIVWLFIGCALINIPVVSYFRYSYTERGYEVPEVDHHPFDHMISKFVRNGSKKDFLTYVIQGPHGLSKRCVYVSERDKKNIQQALSVYAETTPITTCLINSFLAQKKQHTKVVGYVLQDCMYDGNRKIDTIGKVQKFLDKN